MSLRFDASQQLRTGQHLRLAPKLIQSMEILQLPLPALEERIERELESNVALELAEAAPAESEDGSTHDGAPGLVADGTAEQFERLRDMERRYGELWNGERSSRAGNRFAGERDPKMAAMANAPSRGESLESQLSRQWSLVDAEPDIAAAGERILEFVDEDGLLHTSLEQILDQSRSRPGVAWSMALLEAALARLQRELEPAGVAARDLRESLRLQIEAQIRDAAREGTHAAGESEATAWTDALELVEHHYDDLLQNRLPRIAQQSKLSMDRINEARERLRKLSIAPGRELVESRDGPVYPDVIVEYDPTEDRYVAALQEGSIPSLRISPQYRKMAKDRSLDAETRVVEKVIERQREFLDHGPHFLKPMPMIDVAAELGLHVGTVSRAVSEKWIQTPRGIFPLRKLFSGGQESSDGEDRSWEAIKAELKEVVDAEDRTKPLSDRAIAEALEARGIRIARRTVVKYREQMGIPSARQRREHR
jgi:RNA polymerase sigma-54 factor